MRNVDCDLCGKETEPVDAVVEGAMLKVCVNCARFGNVVPLKKIPKETKKEKVDREESQLIVPDFSIKIRRARDKFGMMQEDVARRLNEKLSVIQKIEIGEIKPSMELALKLERFFRIKLIEDYGQKEEIEDKPKIVNFKENRLTVGDLIKMKDRKV